MLTLGVALVLLAGLGTLAVWLARTLQAFRVQAEAGLDQRNGDVERRLQGITETMDRRLGALDAKVPRRLEHAWKQPNAIHKQLGDVGRATATHAQQAKDLAQVKHVCRTI